MSYTQQLTKKQIRDKLHYLKKTNQIEKYKKALKKYRDESDDEEEQPKPTQLREEKPPRVMAGGLYYSTKQQYPEQDDTETEEDEPEQDEKFTQEELNDFSDRINHHFTANERETLYKWFSLIPTTEDNNLYYRYYKQIQQPTYLKKQISTINPYEDYMGF
jgi:hypothetical protein